MSPIGNFCDWQAIIEDVFFLSVSKLTHGSGRTKIAAAVNILASNVYHCQCSMLTQL